MGEFPTFSKDNGILKVTFSDIPLWTGLQRTVGVKKSVPFELTTENGPIMQSTSAEIIDEVVAAYKVDEYNFITAPPGSSTWADSIGDSKIQDLTNVFAKDKPPCSVLEIGAGSTWIGNNLCDLYEISSYVAIDPTIQNSDKKIEVIREYFPHPKIADRRFELIVGFSVLEHVTDPIIFLNNIKDYLAENGTVVLAYPDCEEQLQKGDINVFLHEHISYFTEASSRWLAAKCGFEVKSLASLNDRFTIELQRATIEKENIPVIDESEILMNSVERFLYLFCNIKDKIMNCLNSGLTVGFHGATNGLNTFLYVTKLSKNPNIYVYDGDTSKQGLYLPTCTSPILSPNDTSYSKHGLLLISAMSFYEQIANFASNETCLRKEQIVPLVGLDSL